MNEPHEVGAPEAEALGAACAIAAAAFQTEPAPPVREEDFGADALEDFAAEVEQAS